MTNGRQATRHERDLILVEELQNRIDAGVAGNAAQA